MKLFTSLFPHGAIVRAFFLIAMIFLIQSLGYAQLPNFVWSKSAGGADADRGAGLALDQDNNVIVTGQFSGAATFSSDVTLTSSGGSDIFVAKYDKRGRLLWANQVGSVGEDSGRSVAADGAGNAVVVGVFSGTVVFGPGATLESTGDSDMFVAKYDRDGTLIWANRISDTGLQQTAFKVATDKNDNALVAGLFTGTVAFSPSVSFTSSGDSDAFIAKYDQSGNLLWARQVGGPDHDEGVGVSADDQGNIFLAGIFAQTATFKPGLTLTSAGEWDAYFAKYDASGNLLFAKQAGGVGFDEGYSALTDHAGNIIFVGTFEETASFTSGMSLTEKGGGDTFIAKYDGSGNLIWLKQIGGPAFDQGREFALDEAGYIYVGGRFRDTADFGSGVWLTGVGGNDIFVAKYDPSGNALWAKRAGATGSDAILDIDVDRQSGCYVTGTIGDRVRLGSGIPLLSRGTTDFFVAKMTDFDLCLEDTRNRTSLYKFFLNTNTGEYQVINCSTTFAITGVGELTRKGCRILLKDKTPFFSIEATINQCSQRGRASIDLSSKVLVIDDRNTTDNIGVCPGE